MERPNAATVALLLTRVVLPKEPWLAAIGSDVSWPMNGIPRSLHLDNAAEFKSRALRAGCSEYGITLTYRPVGRPHFGGHIERMNRTLMDRLRGVPGATGNSVKGRKERKPEKYAALTLAEFEKWMVLEIAQRYHHSEHRGLMGATPYRPVSKIRVKTGHFDQILKWQRHPGRHSFGFQVRRVITKSLQFTGGIRAEECQIGWTNADALRLQLMKCLGLIHNGL
jgi:hypothetical protein